MKKLLVIIAILATVLIGSCVNSFYALTDAMPQTAMSQDCCDYTSQHHHIINYWLAPLILVFAAFIYASFIPAFSPVFPSYVNKYTGNLRKYLRGVFQLE